ncbi:MAG: hypothetical protein U9O94_01615 [Nanoarchaeota archaeon]|nr:hypothetical protein [Nanoarchaeota archaeon]
MVLAQITGFVIILLGIFIGLTHFELIPDTISGFNLVSIGILVFIAHEAYALISNYANTENKLIGVGVPLLFVLIAGSYFIREFVPESISSSLTLVIAVLMCAEGLYRLH